MEPNDAFGPWVKRRRRSLALTQDELAQRVAIIVTIRKVESGDLRPSKVLAEKLAEALEISPEQKQTFMRFVNNGGLTEFLLHPSPTKTCLCGPS